MESGAASEGVRRFYRECADRKRGLVVDLEPESSTMLIAFGGLAGRLAIPPFEFFESVSRMSVKKMLVRDLHQCWYQRGVEGAGADVDGTSETLAGLITGAAVERTVAVGNSAGGYAALLFGRLLGIDEVHAFVPQTLIDPEVRWAFGDRRWPGKSTALRTSGWLDTRYADLRPVLSDADRPRSTSFHVYYSRRSQLEETHACNLAGVDGVILHEMEESGSAIVRAMRDSGELEELLESAVQSSPGTDA